MQGHRNQHVGSLEQLASGAGHPAAHGRGEVGPVLVFQGMHQRPRDVVIAYRGAGPPVGRWVGDGLHRQQFGPGIIDKGNAEPRAVRLRDERQLRPAFRADTLAIDWLTARNAQRRQRDIERQPWNMREHATGGIQHAAQMGGYGAWW